MQFVAAATVRYDERPGSNFAYKCASKKKKKVHQLGEEKLGL